MFLKNNNKKISVREFHITDLPKKELYILLNKSFREIFFRRLYKLIGGSTILGRKLLVNNETIRRWKVGLRAIPNLALLKLNNSLEDKKFSIEEIEGNIIAYRGESSKNPITKPNLPIIEDERLIRIVTHLICDGYDGGKKHLPVYINTEKQLIKDFIDDLLVFGDVPINFRERKPKKGRKLSYTLEFPRIFTHILRKIYKIEFSGLEVRLPGYFFNLDPILASQVIKAFGDDEGHVRESGVFFGISGLSLVNDFKRLMINNLDMDENYFTKVKVDPKNPKFYFFEIRRNLVDDYSEKVGFRHPRKEILLNFILKRESTTGNKYPVGVAKNKILELLSIKPDNAINLALKIGIKPKNVRYHLENLKKENKITISHKGPEKTNIWRIIR